MKVLPLPTAAHPDGLAPDLVEKLRGMPKLNVLWMLSRTGWLPEINALLGKMFDDAQFPARDREVMILRISAQTGVDYPIPQHRIFARNVGLSAETVDAILQRDLNRLDSWTARLCQISEEITAQITLSEASLADLVAHYGRHGATRAIWLMGWFNMLVRFTSSTRLPIEPDFESTAALTGPA